MTPASPSATGRLAGFDILRGLGAFAVVWIHACDTSSLARRLTSFTGFAVPCFVMMSFFLLQRKILGTPKESFVRRLWPRVTRLAPAYLGWTAIYLLARVVKHAVVGGGALEVEWLSWLLLGAASYQLYFVPALIYGSILFLPLMMWGALAKRRWGISMSMAVSAILLVSTLWIARLAPYQRLPFELRQMVGLAWMVPLAAGMAMLAPLGIRLGWPGKMVACVVGGTLFGLGVAGWFKGAAYVLAVTGSLFGLSLIRFDVRLPVWLSRLSVLSFGIYLCHGLFVEGLQTMLTRFGVGLESFPMTFAVIVLSFCGAWMLCERLDRTVKGRGWVR